jgi:hypothetical protein
VSSVQVVAGVFGPNECLFVCAKVLRWILWWTGKGQTERKLVGIAKMRRNLNCENVLG